MCICVCVCVCVFVWVWGVGVGVVYGHEGAHHMHVHSTPYQLTNGSS